MGLVAPTLPDSDQQKTAFGAYWQTGVFALRLNLGSISWKRIAVGFLYLTWRKPLLSSTSLLNFMEIRQ